MERFRKFLDAGDPAKRPTCLELDAQAPHAWRLLGAAENDLDAVQKVVGKALSLPGATVHEVRKIAHRKQDSPLEALRKYDKESRPRWNPAVVWKTFRNMVADLKFSIASCKVTPFEEAVMDEWPADKSTPAATLVNRLRPFYAWPDKLADLSAARYRSGFILCGFLPAVGGALAAINNQGEFRRIAKRSHAMHSSISRLITRIDALDSKMKAPETAGMSFLPAVRDISQDAADLLVREVLDWRVLFLDRPPEVGA